MLINQEVASNTHQACQNSVAEAIRAWHRGDQLSEEQLTLIDLVQRKCFARALGYTL